VKDIRSRLIYGGGWCGCLYLSTRKGNFDGPINGLWWLRLPEREDGKVTGFCAFLKPI